MKVFRKLLLLFAVMSFTTSAVSQDEGADGQEWDMIGYNLNEILLLNTKSVFKDGYNIHGTIRLEKLQGRLGLSKNQNIVTADVVADCINSKLKIENLIAYDDDQMTNTNPQTNKDNVKKEIYRDYRSEIMDRLCEETR